MQESETFNPFERDEAVQFSFRKMTFYFLLSGLSKLIFHGEGGDD